METTYRYLNLVPLPLWLAMLLAPQHPATERASRSSGLFITAALHYGFALILALRQRNGAGLPDFATLEGVRRALGSPGGALAGWSHMLALDLFTGAWIYRQARRLNAPAWVRVPVLLLTMMAGPLGLLLFLLWRWLVAGSGEALPGVRM
jgi:hypothetical protein